MPQRALDPTGVVLVDKPAGPSSFAVVRELRDRTGARAGHAGTLDPFATGLLIVLLGRATKLQPRFVGLDKRYRAQVELTATSSTGDPEGELTACEPPDRAALEARLAALRGEVPLPVPAFSAVHVEGERAYRLARRGAVVAMPVRLARVHALELVEFDGRLALLELHVGSGTYVRAIAEALGGHCRELRRTAVGPFAVGEADATRIVPLEQALARL